MIQAEGTACAKVLGSEEVCLLEAGKEYTGSHLCTHTYNPQSRS